MLSGKQRKRAQREVKLPGYSGRACLSVIRTTWRCFTIKLNSRVEAEYLFVQNLLKACVLHRDRWSVNGGEKIFRRGGGLGMRTGLVWFPV